MILLMDYNEASSKRLYKILHHRFPDELIAGFTNPMMAAKFAFKNSIELLITRVAMKPINGFDLARLVCKFNGRIPVYYMEDDNRYKEDSLSEDCARYFTVDSIEKEVNKMTLAKCSYAAFQNSDEGV